MCVPASERQPLEGGFSGTEGLGRVGSGLNRTGELNTPRLNHIEITEVQATCLGA